MQKKSEKMPKNSINAEKFRIDSSIIFIASASYPAKSYKNSINAENAEKFRKYKKTS
jgi:hypothetical protein